MGEEIAIPKFGDGHEVAIPGTGAIVDLSDGVAAAQALDDLREFEKLIYEAKQALTRAIAAHAEGIGMLTFELPDGRKAEVTLRPEIVYEAEVIEQRLREAGMPEERIREIVKEEVTYKVVAKEAKKAAAANYEYASIIEDAKTEVPRNPSVTIRRR